MHDNSKNHRDTLFADPMAEVSDFVFDQRVVDIFPDMIKRSVPGYSTILHMIGQLSAKYVQSGSHCYDLGCSLGAATLAMRHSISALDTKIIGVDNSKDMLKRCQQVIDADAAETPIELIEANIQEVNIEKASVVVLNFTLQFVPLDERKTLLKKIYEGMLPGGILILSEKLRFDDNHHNQLMIELHHHFKRANGYSDLEIAQKREAIEDVLVPETLQEHTDRLTKIGFKGVDLWFQCFNFSSLIAFK